MAGPATRLKFSPALLMARALGRSSGPTSSAIRACRAGMLKAKAVPWANVTAISCHTCTDPDVTSRHAATAVSPTRAWVTSRTLRREKRSATTPAMGERRAIGTPQPTFTAARAVVEPESW